MDAFSLTRQLGRGAYATVWKATRKKDGKVVAVKHLNACPDSLEECKNLPEIKALSKIIHPNVISLLQVVRQQELFLVFEFCDFDLNLAVVSYRDDGLTSMDEAVCRWTMRQLLAGLQAIHKGGFVHLDLKPENVMVVFGAAEVVLKIADFGQAAVIRPGAVVETYVGTRWYRAPELLLGDLTASAEVDVWAAGCIFAELLLLRPLFPGDSATSTLFQIYTTVPVPSEAEWPQGHKLAKDRSIRWPTNSVNCLEDVMPKDLSTAGLALITSMLTFAPPSRFTCSACLASPFFARHLPEVAIKKPTKREPLTREALDQQRANVKAIMTRVQGGSPEPQDPGVTSAASPQQARSGLYLNGAMTGPTLGNGVGVTTVTEDPRQEEPPVGTPPLKSALGSNVVEDSSSDDDNMNVPVRPKPNHAAGHRRKQGLSSKFDPTVMKVNGGGGGGGGEAQVGERSEATFDQQPAEPSAVEADSRPGRRLDQAPPTTAETRRRREPLSIAGIAGQEEGA
mmetsp:Transcript_6084/g.12743  ORF Transcript_6084/g.12743 Transcript_6084/m.12743 type:complete len:510 (-) Transcript_6084:139-1668(-)